MAQLTWANPVSGNWSVATNWVDRETGQHAVPGANDSATIFATGGSYTVTLDVNATVVDFALESAGATFTANSKTFTVGNFAAIREGQVIWNNSNWAGAGAFINSDRVTFRGNSTISSPFTQEGNLLVEGTSAGASTLTMAVGFENKGTITLDSTSVSAAAKIAVTNGALLNAVGGKLISNDGASLIGQGGSTLREISANLTNKGSVNFGVRTLLSLPGGNFENNGETVIEADASVSFGSNPTFTQSGGTLNIGAASGFAMSGGKFDFQSGSVIGTPSLRGSTLNLTADSAGAFDVCGGTLSGTAGAGLSITHYGNVNRGQTVDPEFLELAPGFVNNGSITVTTIVETTGQKRQSQRSSLRMASGTLVNNGVITLDAGPAGNLGREFYANLQNNGVVNINSGWLVFGQQHTNNGDLNIAAQGLLQIPGSQEFTQAGGNLRQASNETFQLGTGGTFRYSGGAITGVPKLHGPTLRLQTANPASFLLMGGGTLVGDVAFGQELIIHATQGQFFPGVLTSATGFKNRGIITLSDQEAKLTVTTGTLINEGVINSAPSGTSRANTINGNLTNNGTLNFDNSVELIGTEFVNNGTLNTDGGATSLKHQQNTNNGNIIIAASPALVGTTSGATFVQAGGEIRMVNDDSFTMNPNGTFQFTGGSIIGQPNLFGCTLNLGTENPARFKLTGSSTLVGNVAAGQELSVRGASGGFNPSSSGTLTSASSFTNAGKIHLVDDNSRLTVTSGTLTNAATGMINAGTAGTTSERRIYANLFNEGTLNVNTITSLYGTQNTNKGNIVIAASPALFGTTSGVTFVQAGGEIRMASDDSFTMYGNSTFRFTGGTITGTPQFQNSTLDIGPNSGSATISMRGSSSLLGNVLAGQTIKVQGDATAIATLKAENGFSNAGKIVLETVNGSSNASSLMVTSGTLTNLVGGEINVNAGGGGSRNLTTELANAGKVNINTATTLGRASADHVNSGTIHVSGGDLTVSQSGTTPTFANSGTLDVASGRTLNISGGTLANFNAGTLTGGNYIVAGTFKFPGAAITTNAATIVLEGAASQIVNESNTNGLANLASNAASGSLRIQNARNFTTGSGIAQFTNAGVLQIKNGSTFTVGNGKRYQQTSGSTIVEGTLATTDSVGTDIQGGSLHGNGVVQGNVRNAGDFGFGEGPGDFDITGDYTQTATGSLSLELFGTTPITQFDQLRITGAANLAGTVDVGLGNSFTPSASDTFQFLTAASQSGTLTPRSGTTLSSTTNLGSRANAFGQVLFTNNDPTLAAQAAFTIAENTTVVATLSASDADIPTQSLTYRVTGGADQTLFEIIEGNRLKFKAAPDFEQPADQGQNNIYNVQVAADDGHGGTATQDIAVTVQFVPPSVLVTVAVSPASVLENGAGNMIFTFTRSVTTGSLVVNFNVGGSATLSGNDYQVIGATAFNGTTGSVTFANGQATKTVTIDPTADTVSEPNETVILTVVSTANYQPGTPKAATGTIRNVDVPGFSITPATGVLQVGENGSTANFTVQLTARPTSNVQLIVSSSDTTEATVGPATLTFTPSNWNVAQTVTVKGVDDVDVDGAVASTVTVRVNAATSDNAFDALASKTVNVSTSDNDFYGFRVLESNGSTSVSEVGTTDTMTVVLAARPTSNVVLNLTSSDIGEATVTPATLTFTSSNWNLPQTVTVKGVNDDVVDGSQISKITIKVNAALSENRFDAFPAKKVNVTTTDNEVAGFRITQTGSTSVHESGTTDTLTVVLTARPLTDVVLSVICADSTEATATPVTLVFTSLNWNRVQTVTVRGVDDDLIDGNQVSLLTVSVIDASSDNLFDHLSDQTLNVTTVDNDL